MKPLTNCINCGGILDNGVCPFCGADYNKARELSIDLDKNQFFATIRCNGKEYKAYLSHMDIEPIVTEPCRDIRGIMRMTKIGTLRTWIFVQLDPVYED